MKRVNGFIDLDDYFKDISGREKRNLIHDSKYIYFHFWVNINGEIYYFKPVMEIVDAYKELVASYVAKHLGIEAISYDLAIFKDYMGVISKNYRKKYHQYIPGYDILGDYLDENREYIKEMGLDKKYIETNELNNFEIIWQALEYRYQYYPGYNSKEIMDKIILQYIFGILVAEKDKGCQNWEIEEGIEKIDLVPLYDNEYSFKVRKEEIPATLSVTPDDYNNSIYESLKTFLNISSREYIDLFLEKYNMYTTKLLLVVFKEIEEQIDSKIPLNIKVSILYNYGIHRNRINKILNELELNKRKV